MQQATELSRRADLRPRARWTGRAVQICAMEPKFIGGSMGCGGGREDHARHRALASQSATPLIIVSASGGARMQEGAISLMQMAKISAALMRLDEARLPYISVLTDPTTGGVTASFAMLGDLNIAEPGALIGFAGPRVIEQTIRQKLPEGFQRSEFLLKHGMLDAVVPRARIEGVHLHGAATSSAALSASVNYPDSVQFLYSLGNEIKTAKLGLERIGAVLDALGDPQRRLPLRPRRRHQRQGLHLRHDRIRPARRRPAHRTLHLAAPGRAHRAHPDRRARRFPRAQFAAAFDTRARGVPSSCSRRAPSTCTPPTSRPSPPWRSCSSREQGARRRGARGGTGRTAGCHQRGDAGAVRDHADRFRSRSVSGPEPGSDRGGEGGHSQSRACRRCFAAQRPEAAAVLRGARRGTLGSPSGGTTDWPIDDLELDARGSRFHAERANATLRIVCPLAGEHQVENAAHRRGGAAAPGRAGRRRSSGASRRRAGPAAWSASPRSPRSSWMARTIRPAPARWPPTSSASTRTARCALIYGAMRDKAVDEIGGHSVSGRPTVIATAPAQERAARPETIRELSGRDTLVSQQRG